MVESLEFKAHLHGAEEDDGVEFSFKQYAVLGVCWVGVMALLSIPSVFYALSTSLPPGENLLDLNKGLLELFHLSTGSILALISAYVLPFLAKSLVKLVNGGVEHLRASVNLMMVGRLVVCLLVPLVMVIVLNHQCLGKWTLLWRGCSSSSSFDIKGVLLQDQVDRWIANQFCGGHQHPNVHSTCGFRPLSKPSYVLHHQMVCDPPFNAKRCPRAVVESVGTLIVSKLLTTALLDKQPRL